MAFTVTNTDGSVIVTVADTVIDPTYSLKLIGRDVSGYGETFVENTIRGLENFASATAPSGTKLIGQLWYDKSEELFKVWTGTGWKRATNIVVSDSQPTTSLTAGTGWFDTRTDKLKIHDGSSFKLSGYAGEVSNAFAGSSPNGNPNNFGTKLRNIFFTASDNTAKPVLALVHVSDGTVNEGATTTVNGKETIISVFSDHATFTMKNSVSSTEGESINYYPEFVAASGIGISIQPGINSRREYGSRTAELSIRGLRADAAYKLNTGSPSSDSANIAAVDVIHTHRSYIPTSGNTYFLGGPGKAFARLSTNQIVLGSGGTSEIQANGTVNIGNATSPFNNIFADTVTVNDAIFLITANLATATQRVSNSFFTNLDTTTATINDYSLPSADGSAGQVVVTDGSGTLSFANIAAPSVGLTTAQASAIAANTAKRSFPQSDENKLDGIETNATQDQTESQIIHIIEGATGNNRLDASHLRNFPASTDGTISAVGAGSGLTGGGSSGAVNLDIGAGTYMIVNANDIAVDATARNTVGKVVARDGSGNFAAGVITAVATSARYADLAELYLPDMPYSSGTVVTIGGCNEITAADGGDMTDDFFGVVSTQPAHLMNEELENGLPVALAGRVPVRVTGVVDKGARLVMSDIPGVTRALHPNEHWGAYQVVGRALEAKPTIEEGMVEAVVSMNR